jgi:putative protein-disulfide isomerase
MLATDRLIYVADPMCSWCWGFGPVLALVCSEMPKGATLEWVMGGLAPDSDEPMPPETRAYVQRAWQTVAAETGAPFNFEFWERCSPRRSTYPACRAVLAAGERGPDLFMRIQRAYYVEARNPSDTDVLIELAGDVELDRESFAEALASPEVEALLRRDLARRDELGVRTFPTLLLERAGERRVIARGFSPPEEVLAALS